MRRNLLMNNLHKLLAILFGFGLGVTLLLSYQIIFIKNNTINSEPYTDKPLYWVAPMDANFRRDKPGKSPMGMDLVPVFANENSASSSGTITINASVENNLGVKTTVVKQIIPHYSIRTFGYVQYNEDTLVHIHPRTEGWIEKLFVGDNGDYVEKGAPLYSIYSPELVNAQEEYLLAVKQGNKTLIQAANSRLSAMRVPQTIIEDIRLSKKVQQQIIFSASQNGFIDGLNIREGFYVKPSTTLMAIAGLKEVWIQAEILARDAAKLQTGQVTKVTSDFFPGLIIEGEIEQIYPQVNVQTRAVEARIRVPNPNYALKPNMFVDIDISTSSSLSNKIIAIPSEAVIRTGQQNRVVLALGKGQFKSIEVVLGQIFDDQIEILEGLEINDEVVISAQFLLDSESSISSDFKRMSSNEENTVTIAPSSDEKLSAWTQATINEIIEDEREVNISHGELSAWGMPAMTMNFMVAENIDMSRLEEGMSIHINVTESDMGMFMINTIHIMDDVQQIIESEHIENSHND
jgi:Cu(I)/Ag(I) efflux system membrane fusion protein